MEIFTLALPIVLRLVGYILDWVGASKETKKAFLDFIQQAENNLGISVKLNDQDRAAADDLRREWEEIQKKKNPTLPG